MLMLRGTVERVTFYNEKNHYRVFRLKQDDRREMVTVVGKVPSLQPGETVSVEGEWIHHPQFGTQFQLHAIETMEPTTADGIMRFLGSGLIKGIGKSTARKLVERFGVKTLDIIEFEPHRLSEISGIGTGKIERMVRGYVEHREVREMMVYLQGHGVRTALAMRIYREYGKDTIAAIEANPYRLAHEVVGIGFKTADGLAKALGVAHDAPERLAAGVLYVLQRAGEEGHVFLPRKELVARTVTLLQCLLEQADDALGRLREQRDIAVEPNGEDDAIYTAPLFHAEQGLAHHIRRILQHGVETDIEEAPIEEQSAGCLLAPEQRQAIACMIREPFVIVTGGPGTGKTTTVRAMIATAQRIGWRVELAAPTGRAAKRLTEAAGREARTIHRLLEYAPNDRGAAFQRNGDHPINAQLLIVDEVSMLDVVLAYHLLKAVPSHCRLVFVGDVDQLPSVGPGQILTDLIRTARVPVIRLTTVFRQAEQSLIVQNAHRIHQGLLPNSGKGNDDFFFLEQDEPEAIAETIVDLCARRLPDFTGESGPLHIQALSPMRRGSIGIDALNERLQAALNPPLATRAEHVANGYTFRVGDKVMQMRNNYQREVYNGDIGLVAAIDEDESECSIVYGSGRDERRVAYSFGDLDELKHAFCISIHKSQGSEFPIVVLPVSLNHYMMLERNLIYTAITRARKLVVIVGSRAALQRAVGNETVASRNTLLANRLRDVFMSNQLKR